VKIDIKHVAKLAKLTLTEDEKKKFTKQLGETIEYINKLEEIDTKDVHPTSQVTGLENIARKDNPQPSLSQRKVLSNAKSTHNGMFKVKAIFEE
jgi:aspartyl-tRNA(Asn)/glutamyl-tRNA(Gln) amidotransferase subunit C